MEFLASKFFFAALLIACSYATSETGLTALTNYDCGCPGQNASYICTATDGVITVWAGNAFDCPDRNEISLRHSQFENTIGECNDGAIVGYSIESVNNSFTSRLDVRLSADLQGRTITCSVDDGSGVTLLGSRMLIVSTTSASPPAPEGISTQVVNNELIFRWNQIDPDDYNCSTLQYDFMTSQNCGNCARVTPRVVSCTGFQPSSAGTACFFTVGSVVCGNVTGTGSMLSTNVNLKVPDPPTVQSLPLYQDGRIQILIELRTTFHTVQPSFISDGIDGSVRDYTITYIDSTFGSRCGSANIQDSSCMDGICAHNFDILQSSSCPPSTAIIVSVVANNVLGSGPPSSPLFREGFNNLVDVNFDPNRRSIICTFLNQQSNIMKQCKANITYGENCEIFLDTYSGMDIGDTVETQQLEAVPGVVEYCFLVNATSNNVTVLVDGTLQNLDLQASNNSSIAAAIAIPLVLVLLVLAVFVILGPIIAWKRSRSVAKSTVCVKFSVEDKPGSLARALKVFKDCKVNILGLNTHLHHADFNRDAGNGYKFNYIHCMCTPKDKNFLKEKFKAEFVGGDKEHDLSNEKTHVTAIIKVKDSPGALWKALDTTGVEGGINIVGVNTLTDRESTTGYKDNYVRCCCSEVSLHMVRTQLKSVTGKEVTYEFLDEACDGKERAIEYLVKDRVGSLAKTLQVISDMGINISGVNLDHLPTDVHRTTRDGAIKINFIECESIERSEKKTLIDKLKGEYGAIDAIDHGVSPDKLQDPNNSVIKVTVQNETGSLNRILKAFHDLDINISGVNVLDCVFKREKEIQYKHYHLEITATNDQEANLKERLLVGNLAIDIKPFQFIKDDIQCESDENDSSIDETGAGPTTRRIQFYVRDEVGALANAFKVFGELAINITKVNPAHLSPEHQVEFVECSCAESQRESLIEKLKSYGAIKAEVLPQKKLQQGKMTDDANYCILKFSVGPEAESIKVLNAFPDMGVKVFKINPAHIKVYNQYVECCCTEEEKTKLIKKLGKITGVTNVSLEPNSLVSEMPTDDPNYCIIKYSIGDQAGTLVRALTVFFDLDINIIGVNTLNCAFDRKATIKYKHNHVVLVATDEQEEELRQKLLINGLAIDVKPYQRMWRSDNTLQPESVGKNDIVLTSIKVQDD